MEKRVAAVVLAVGVWALAVAPARAQDYGLLVGYSRTTAEGPIPAPTPPPNVPASQVSVSRTRREGSSIGMFIATSVRRRLGVEVDVLWSTKGVKVNAVGAAASSAGLTTFSDHLLRYVEIPLLARVNVAKIHGREIHVVVGPSLGIRVTGGKGLISTYDPALVAGGGVTLGNAIIQLRYERGLHNLAIGDGPLGGGVWRNRAFILTAALLI